MLTKRRFLKVWKRRVVFTKVLGVTSGRCGAVYLLARTQNMNVKGRIAKR